MLNLLEGEALTFQGEYCARSTGLGQTHLVFGPYVSLAPGRYLATFRLALVSPDVGLGDRLCAVLDIAADDGGRVLATDFVFASELGGELRQIQLAFELVEPSHRVEFRLRASAAVPIIAADDASCARSDAASEPPSQTPRCDLARHHPHEIVDLFARGYQVLRSDRYFRFQVDGIVIAASDRDDLNFVGEVLENRTYNVLSGTDICAIDIGLNVGLTSLSLAAKANVKEVHSFEPFPSTYDKARRNLSLNPALEAKVSTYNVGLSDHDGDETILVPDTADSGSRATISVEGGRPVRLSIRDAATVLRPIIAAARAKERQVIVKVDCEGSEFAIFQTLSSAGLLRQIDAMMVEWHAMFADKTGADLIAPLVAAGFIVIDLSPPNNNGFFYAIKNRRPVESGIVRKLARLVRPPGK